MNSIVLIAIFDRHEMVRTNVELLKKQTKRPLIFLIVSTKEDWNLANSLEVDLIIWSINTPLGKKWQKGISICKRYSPDFIIILGSDDILSLKYIESAEKYISQGYELVSLKDWYVYNTQNNNLYNCKYKSNRSIGAGRIISKKILDRINWKLFPIDKNNTLDYYSMLNLKKGLVKNISVCDEELIVLSIKGPWECINKVSTIINCKSILTKKISNPSHFFEKQNIYDDIIYYKDNSSTFKNIRISKAIQFFKDKILKTYPKLIDLHDIYKPTIFFGMYREEDYVAIKRHKSKGLIIWGGTDSTWCLKGWRGKNYLQILKNNEQFYHIAQSKWISDDLNKLNISHKLLPWYSFDKSKFKCVEKGECIYIYLPSKYYGSNLFNQVKEKLKGKYKFIIGGGNLNTEPKIPYNKIAEIYSKCFIGLRLVPHDGLGSTVQELGLMGIKCVHNGNSPSALNYKNIDDIIKHIENEAKTIGFRDEKLSKKVDDYLQIPDTFFKVNEYF